MEESAEKKLHEEVIATIEFIKQSYKNSGGYEDPIEVFKWGNCGNLCTFLMEEFPDKSIPCGIYKDEKVQHIVTKIGERYYDIDGEVTPKSYVSYLMNARTKDYGMDYISTNVDRYSIRQVEQEEIEKNTDNFDAPIIMVNGVQVGKRPSSELGRMKKIKEDLQKRREGVLGDSEHGER